MATRSAFIDICAKAGGAIGSVRCPEAGRVGECAMAPNCTSQTLVFEYEAADLEAARASCAVSAGAIFTP